MESIAVNETAQSEEATMLLARAFDLAWERYYAPGQGATVSHEVARPKLAAFLVEMARSGVKEEEALAACGVLHLIALSDSPAVPASNADGQGQSRASAPSASANRRTASSA